MIGFGIDLAGYTTGKTSLAVIEIKGRRAKATLLRGSALSVKRESGVWRRSRCCTGVACAGAFATRSAAS